MNHHRRRRLGLACGIGAVEVALVVVVVVVVDVERPRCKVEGGIVLGLAGLNLAAFECNMRVTWN